MACLRRGLCFPHQIDPGEEDLIDKCTKNKPWWDYQAEKPAFAPEPSIFLQQGFVKSFDLLERSHSCFPRISAFHIFSVDNTLQKGAAIHRIEFCCSPEKYSITQCFLIGFLPFKRVEDVRRSVSRLYLMARLLLLVLLLPLVVQGCRQRNHSRLDTDSTCTKCEKPTGFNIRVANEVRAFVEIRAPSSGGIVEKPLTTFL